MNNDAFRMMTVEMQIYNLISNCKQEGEEITKDLHFDFKLPKGLKMLDWPEVTVVEVKKRLVYDSISMLRFYIDRYSPAKLIVIVEEETPYLYKYRAVYDIPGRPIEIMLFSDFKNKVKDLLGKNKYSLKNYEMQYKNLIRNNQDKLKNEIKENRISLFLGAGVSQSAKLPSWSELLDCLSTKVGLQLLCSKTDEPVKGRSIIEKYKEKATKSMEDENHHNGSNKMELENKKLELLCKDLSDILYKNDGTSKLIEAIAKFIVKQHYNIESVITYNYDNLLEHKINEELNNEELKCLSIYENSKPIKKNIYIKHVHGFIDKDLESDSSEIVLGEKEYHKLYDEPNNWGNVEQLHALNNSMCIFIGLSMTDPNLRRLLDLAIGNSDGDSIHYVFLQEKCDAYVDFMERDMKSLGVNCIWYKQHNDIPNILSELI